MIVFLYFFIIQGINIDYQSAIIFINSFCYKQLIKFVDNRSFNDVIFKKSYFLSIANFIRLLFHLE